MERENGIKRVAKGYRDCIRWRGRMVARELERDTETAYDGEGEW
jgi:hypothetical protein